MNRCLLLAPLMSLCLLGMPLTAQEVTIVEQETSQEASWGYHLLLDCKGCDIAKITSQENLSTFVKILVDAIDMKRYGEPILAHFAEHNPEAAGYSLLQLIETSSITGHFVDKNGDAYIDIFSCKPFKPEVALKVVEELLGPKQVKMRYLIRQA